MATTVERPYRRRNRLLVGLVATILSCLGNLAYLAALILWELNGDDDEHVIAYWLVLVASGIGGLALALVSSRLRPVGVGIINGAGIAFALLIAWIWYLVSSGVAS
jgi:hypothetical protein